jgi:hypothetical protein
VAPQYWRKESVEWAEVIEGVLALVRPTKDALRSFARKDHLRIEMHVCAEVYGEALAPIGPISEAVVAELTELGVGIDIDLYTGSHDAELDSAH